MDRGPAADAANDEPGGDEGQPFPAGLAVIPAVVGSADLRWLPGRPVLGKVFVDELDQGQRHPGDPDDVDLAPVRIAENANGSIGIAARPHGRSLATWEPPSSDVRDAALLLSGWRAALRIDALQRLDVADLRVEDADGGGVAGGGGRRVVDRQTGAVLVVGLLAAVAAAGANAGAALLQAMAARRATRALGVLLSPVYAGGLLLDITGWVLTVVALRFMPIVAVQAIVAGQVAITVVIAHWVFDTPLRRLDLLAAGVSVVGLALLVGSASTDERVHAGTAGAVALLVVFALLLVGGVGSARRSPLALPVAFVAGLSYGATAVAVRLVDLEGSLPQMAREVVTDPVAWLLLGFAVLGLVLYTVALGRSGVGSVVAVLAVTETLAPGLLGLVLLGDGIRSGWWPGFVVGLVLALGGVVVLARSPAQASLAGDDGLAKPPLKRA